jgi:hypothetical protein
MMTFLIYLSLFDQIFCRSDHCLLLFARSPRRFKLFLEAVQRQFRQELESAACGGAR